MLVRVRTARPGPRYSWDERAKALRLVAVEHGLAEPAEGGVVARTEGRPAGPLPVLLVADFPTGNEVLVEARVIAGLAAEDEVVAAVCVPVMDDAAAKAWDDVPAARRDLVLARAAALLKLPSLALVVVPPELTCEAVRRAMAEAAEARARRASGTRYAAAWRVTGPLRAERSGAREAEPHTVAERLLPLLPWRFQQYVERLLLWDERLLAFVERPEMAVPGYIRRRRLPHAIAVLTDRQYLWMEDDLPPGLTLTNWGFRAVSLPAERVLEARVARERGVATLGVRVLAGEAAAALTYRFRADEIDALSEVVAALGRFARPRPSDLRRMYPPSRPESPAVHLGIGDWSALDKEWREGAEAGGVEPCRVLAAASAPPVARSAGGCVLVVRDAALVASGGKRRIFHRVALADLAGVELTLSLLGSRLALIGPRGHLAAVDFEYPDAPAFLAAFTVLRHLLGRVSPIQREADRPGE